MTFFELNTGVVDFPWTFIHFLIPLAIAWILTRAYSPIVAAIIVVLILVAWEAIEFSQGPSGFGGSESDVNQIADLIVGVVGMITGIILARRR